MSSVSIHKSVRNSLNMLKHHSEMDIIEIDSLRAEVQQLREALRLTTDELAATTDRSGLQLEHEVQRFQKIEEELRCLQLEHDLCKKENEELVNDLLDSAQQIEGLNVSLSFKNSAIEQLQRVNEKLQAERDEMAEDLCATLEGDEDVKTINAKLENVQRQAKKIFAKCQTEKEELEAKVKELTEERDALDMELRELKKRGCKESVGDSASNSEVRTRRTSITKVLKDTANILQSLQDVPIEAVFQEVQRSTRRKSSEADFPSTPAKPQKRNSINLGSGSNNIERAEKSATSKSGSLIVKESPSPGKRESFHARTERVPRRRMSAIILSSKPQDCESEKTAHVEVVSRRSSADVSTRRISVEYPSLYGLGC